MLFTYMAQRTQTTIEGKTAVKRKGKIILLVLLCVLFEMLGCRKERGSQETSVKAADNGELKIQKALSMVSDWRFWHGDVDRNNAIMSTIREELYRLNDPVSRKKYVKKFVEIVFAYPLDATDPGREVLYYPLDPTAPGTRREQWFAFCEMSDYVSNFACRQCDMEYQWEVKLRRLKRIRDELRSVEAYLAGNGDSAAFKGDRNGWVKYHKLVQGYYNGFVKELSRFINNILMTHTLSYEKWSDIRSQLETIIGHEVEIKESILNLWEEKRQKEQAQNMK